MTARLRERTWPRFLKAPDSRLIAELYQPGLACAVRYDRCCAYFSSSVLSAAASGFGTFIERILAGVVAGKPAIRLLVNEELSEPDVAALLDAREEKPLIETLLARFGNATTALQKRRLEMLAWLVREGWLVVRVGVMRQGDGIMHAKFGQFIDAAGDAVTFSGSGNESARAIRGNFEKLEISGNWTDPDRDADFRADFDALWEGRDPAVATVALPDAVRDALIKLAPAEAPVIEPDDDRQRQRAAMLWGYALAAPFMPEGGPETCDEMAPVELWPHQRGVVAESAAAWPEGRLLCDEVGMGKTVEAILTLRRLLAGRGVRRALILPPANLLPQWQGELREKGGLRVPMLADPRTLAWPDGTRQTIAGLAEALTQPLLLLSRETARTEANLPAMLAAPPWDLLLLDEGHAARRAEVGNEGEFNSATLLLGLLRHMQATGKARGIIILSATPMQTHPWEPWDLLQVLGEGGLWLSGFHVVRDYYAAMAELQRGALSRASARTLARILAETPNLPPLPEGVPLPAPNDREAFANRLRFLAAPAREKTVRWLRACSPLARRMHRNTRATLRRYFEMGMLDRPPAKRDPREDAFDFDTAEEREVYDAVARYIDRRFDQLEQQKPGKGFVMTIYRRRAASSPFALRQSLERRAQGLKAVIAQRAFDEAALDPEDAGDLEELLNVKLTAALPEDPAEAANELHDVEDLIRKVEALGGLDTKRDRLVRHVRDLTADGRSVLIFTSYADTMTYLRDALVGAFGNSVGSYAGEGGAIRDGSTWTPASKEQVTAALRAGRIRVLVCTDAASEGLNLQAAGALVNFDLPWNPSKIEQRIGRIDRIGQALPVLPIVNLYLKDSVDQRVYRALAERCHLFETFVGPMQPVLSRALRMLMGQAIFNEDELEKLSEKIRNDPTVNAAFPEGDPIETRHPPPLLAKQDAEHLLAALDGSGVTLKAETNARFLVDDGPLRLVIERTEVTEHPDAACIDGLDTRQWKLLATLRRPGERLPLVIASAEQHAHRVVLVGWVDRDGVRPVRSFADLRDIVQRWDGQEPPADLWFQAEATLRQQARQLVAERVQTIQATRARLVEGQIEAARRRLTHELGQMLVCFDPDTDDLTGKLCRMAQDQTETGKRLRMALTRLGAYPDWTDDEITDLRDFRERAGPSDLKSRKTGKTVDAALADPRWRMSNADAVT
jgi:superfamily II DNA or RNA helicase